MRRAFVALAACTALTDALLIVSAALLCDDIAFADAAGDAAHVAYPALAFCALLLTLLRKWRVYARPLPGRVEARDWQWLDRRASEPLVTALALALLAVLLLFMSALMDVRRFAAPFVGALLLETAVAAAAHAMHAAALTLIREEYLRGTAMHSPRREAAQGAAASSDGYREIMKLRSPRRAVSADVPAAGVFATAAAAAAQDKAHYQHYSIVSVQTLSDAETGSDSNGEDGYDDYKDTLRSEGTYT